MIRNFNHQATLAANKATGILAQLSKTFCYWTIKTFKKLHVAFVRPHLEYAIAAWCPYTKKDVKFLEKVQIRATKLVKSIGNLPYEERLKKLGLTTLKARRERGDLIEYFKISKGLSRVDWHNPNKIMNSLSINGPAGNIRGQKHRIVKQLTRIKQRENFMTNRVVENWNKLPQDVIGANSKNIFKNKLDGFIGTQQ